MVSAPSTVRRRRAIRQTRSVIGHDPLPHDDRAPPRPERIGDTEVSYRDAASILTCATWFMSDYRGPR